MLTSRFQLPTAAPGPEAIGCAAPGTNWLRLALGLILVSGIGPVMSGPWRMVDDLPQQVPPVKNFTAFGGNWQVTDGELRASGSGGPKLISQVPEFSTGEVGVEMLLPARQSGVAGLLVKVRQPGLGADSFIGYEVAFDAEQQFLRLGRHRHNPGGVAPSSRKRERQIQFARLFCG